LHLNPRSGRWVPDTTHLQWHVNSAIAYTVWEYHQATADTEFLADHGAESFRFLNDCHTCKCSYNPYPATTSSPRTKSLTGPPGGAYHE